MKVGFVSLGCSKNLIDTEMGISIFRDNDFEIVNNPKEAEIIVVNTCGFIESAKEEAINTILEMAEYKNEKCKYLVAMGCLVKRYKEELSKAIPEVDLWISIDEYKEFWDKISTLLGRDVVKKDYMSYRNRTITTGNKMAYLKIAEGCDNFCTYCAIPYIRGRFESRKMEDILEEARELSEKGYEEIIVIAQDTTKYGIDIYGEYKLAELLKRMCKIEKIKWIRFLYAYPESITDELLEVVNSEDKICKYFDIPIQHFSDSILKKMNRKTTEEKIIEVVNKIRNKMPDAMVRTTLIVGFPGETEKDFEKIKECIQLLRFDRLGCFMYSKEEGTPAANFDNQVHFMTKKKRHKIVMEMQQKISDERMATKVGREYEVLVESITSDGKFYIARSYMDSPDTDGVIFIRKTKEGLINKFINCKIIDYKEYDLIAEII